MLGYLLVLNMLVQYLLLFQRVLLSIHGLAFTSFGESETETVDQAPMMFLMFTAPATVTTLLFLRSRGVLIGCLGILLAWWFPGFVVLADGHSWFIVPFMVLPAGMTVLLPFLEVEYSEPIRHSNPLPIRPGPHLHEDLVERYKR